MSSKVLLIFCMMGLASPVFGQRLIAVYPLQADKVRPKTAEQLDRLLRLVTDQLPGISVQSKEKTKRSIKRVAGRKRDCHRKLSCLVAMGELSAASQVVSGTASMGPEGYQVDLRLIDVAEERIVQREEAMLSGNARAITDGMRELIASLLLPQQGTGTLDVVMLVPGARVMLDDLEVGVTPMDPVTGLRPRTYEFEIVLGGTKPFSRKLVIGHGTTTTVRVSVADAKLVADVEQESRIAEGKPPRVAVVLANALRAPAPAPTPPPAQEVAVVQAVETTPGIEVEPSGDQNNEAAPEAVPWFPLSMVLASAGGVASLLGGIGLAANGIAWLQTDGATDGEVVTDTETYDAMQRDGGMYQGLGLAGAVALPLGAAALAGGIGLLMWKGMDGEVSGEEGQLE